MSVLGRVSLILGLILLIVAIVLATMNFIIIRDYLVALAAQRSREFYNVNSRLLITYLVFFGVGLFLGIGIIWSRMARRQGRATE
jgi:membrane protein implicated in regulation of membrane protease activity